MIYRLEKAGYARHHPPGNDDVQAFAIGAVDPDALSHVWLNSADGAFILRIARARLLRKAFLTWRLESRARGGIETAAERRQDQLAP